MKEEKESLPRFQSIHSVLRHPSVPTFPTLSWQQIEQRSIEEKDCIRRVAIIYSRDARNTQLFFVLTPVLVMLSSPEVDPEGQDPRSIDGMCSSLSRGITYV
jgi:hypothetical protein